MSLAQDFGHRDLLDYFLGCLFGDYDVWDGRHRHCCYWGLGWKLQALSPMLVPVQGRKSVKLLAIRFPRQALMLSNLFLHNFYFTGGYSCAAITHIGKEAHAQQL